MLSSFRDVLKVPEMGFCYACFICNEKTNLLLINAEKYNWRRVSYKKITYHKTLQDRHIAFIACIPLNFPVIEQVIS